jgi:hypothetical protein
VAFVQPFAEQAETLSVKPKQFDQPATFTAKSEQGAAERICGASHILSYVSEVNMWRRSFGPANCAAMTNFAAT